MCDVRPGPEVNRHSSLKDTSRRFRESNSGCIREKKREKREKKREKERKREKKREKENTNVEIQPDSQTQFQKCLSIEDG